MRSGSLLLTTAWLTGFTQAWPWPPSLHADGLKAVQNIEGLLFRRQESEASAAEATPTTSNQDRSTITGSPSQPTGSGSSKSDGGDKSGSKPSGTVDGGSGGNGNSTQTEFDPRLPAGGFQMITPATTALEQYYKIGDWVTLAWNFTSLEVTPTAVNVIAECAKNQATYTLAANRSAQETELLWDTGSYQETAVDQLLTSKYTLRIFDAGASISDPARPGYLGPNSQWQFGMYSPQPYTPYKDYKCPTCSGAMTAAEKTTLKFLFAMFGVTVLSFTWFANSFNVF